MGGSAISLTICRAAPTEEEQGRGARLLGREAEGRHRRSGEDLSRIEQVLNVPVEDALRAVHVTEVEELGVLVSMVGQFRSNQTASAFDDVTGDARPLFQKHLGLIDLVHSRG